MALHASHARNTNTEYRLAAPAWQCSRSEPYSLAKHINWIAALSFALWQGNNEQRNTPTTTQAATTQVATTQATTT